MNGVIKARTIVDATLTRAPGKPAAGPAGTAVGARVRWVVVTAPAAADDIENDWALTVVREVGLGKAEVRVVIVATCGTAARSSRRLRVAGRDGERVCGDAVSCVPLGVWCLARAV
jgi:hypothetical protein